MRKIFRVLAIASFLAFLPAAGTLQAQTPTEARAQPTRAFPNLTPIHRIAGVIDDGSGPNSGIATSVHCTNFKASTAQVQFVVRHRGRSSARQSGV